jgi:low temperature requirement protein LtrA
MSISTAQVWRLYFTPWVWGVGITDWVCQSLILRPEIVLQKRGPDMPLINLIVTLIVVGVLLWLVNTYVPMDRKIKSIMNGVIVIAVVLWLLSAFGVLGNMSGIRVGG